MILPTRPRFSDSPNRWRTVRRPGRAGRSGGHNAGVGLRAPASEADADELARIFAINVFAPIALTAAMVPAMVAGVGLSGVRGRSPARSAPPAAIGLRRNEMRAGAPDTRTACGRSSPAPASVAGSLCPASSPPLRPPRRALPPDQSEAGGRVTRGARPAARHRKRRESGDGPGMAAVADRVAAVTPQLFGRLTGRFGR